MIVNGNPKVYKALRDHLEAVLQELKRIRSGDMVQEELMELIRLISQILYGMKGDSE